VHISERGIEMARPKWKDEMFECQDCGDKLRRGAYLPSCYDRKLCPQCYTKRMMQKPDEPTTIEKAIEALQAKAEFTRDDVISERKALIRKMIQMAGWLEGDPKAKKDVRSHLGSVKSRLDKLIEYESEYNHKLAMLHTVEGVAMDSE